MAALSDKAIKTNYAENKFRYNSGSELQNKEFNDGSGLEMYEMAYRGLDPQLGRFTAIDTLANGTPYLSPSLFAGDKPESSTDPSGAKQMLKNVNGNSMPEDLSSLGGSVYSNPSLWQYNDAGNIVSGFGDIGGNGGGGGGGDGDGEGGGDAGSGSSKVDYSALWASILSHGLADANKTSNGEAQVNLSNLNGNPSQWKIGYNYTANINGEDVAVVGYSIYNLPSQDDDQGGIYITWNYNPNGLTNTSNAWKLYRNGAGRPAVIGNNVIKDLIHNNVFQNHNNRIITGKTTSLTGDFSVDLTQTDFFIGHTNVNYSIVINGNDATVTYTLFVNDGFWDPDFINEKTLGKMGFKNYQPDGMGPNLELGGHPYPFIPVTATETFPNPGYH